MIPFDRWFLVEPLLEYHRVILMKDFMENVAPSIWPAGKRAGMDPCLPHNFSSTILYYEGGNVSFQLFVTPPEPISTRPHPVHPTVGATRKMAIPSGLFGTARRSTSTNRNSLVHLVSTPTVP